MQEIVILSTMPNSGGSKCWLVLLAAMTGLGTGLGLQFTPLVMRGVGGSRPPLPPPIKLCPRGSV